MKSTFLTFFSWLILANIPQAHAVLIKSELDARNKKIQNVTVYFTEKTISKENIEGILGDFTDETLPDGGLYKYGVTNYPNGFYEQINQERLSKELEYIIGYRSPESDYLKNINQVNFNFRNISTKSQLKLMCDFMARVISVLSDIENDHFTRVKKININYAYWDKSTSEVKRVFSNEREKWPDGVDKKKAKFEEWIEDFEKRNKKIRGTK